VPCTRSGVHNLHNLHVWATENPHPTRHSLLQHRFGVSVWAGTVDDCVIRPVEYKIVSVERNTPASLKKRFDFYWRACLHMCARACAFNTAVSLPILHVQCAIGLTITFRTDGLGVEVRSPDLLHFLPI
jgi:hypothetical protein